MPLLDVAPQIAAHALLEGQQGGALPGLATALPGTDVALQPGYSMIITKPDTFNARRAQFLLGAEERNRGRARSAG